MAPETRLLFLLAGLAVFLGTPCRAEGPAVTRQLEPWWKGKRPVEIRAEERRAGIHPESWSADEVTHRTLHVVGYNDRFKSGTGSPPDRRGGAD